MQEDLELSEREIEILKLVATGVSNKEIARELTISPNTVKVHLRNIFSKLGVLSRTEATMTAIRLGLIESPGGTTLLIKTNQSQDAIDRTELSDEKELEDSGRKRKWVWIGILTMVVVLVGILQIRQFFIPKAGSESIVSPDELATISSSRWTEVKNLPSGLSSMAYARYEDLFILFGGKTEQGLSDQVWIYNSKSDIWKEGKKMPSGIKDIQAGLLGEKIYIPGGTQVDKQVSDQFLIYDPRANTFEAGEPLPFPISAYTLVTFEGKLFLFGGFDGIQYRDEILVFDPESNLWTTTGKMKQAAAQAAGIVFGGKIHIIGGTNGANLLKSHNVYYPQRTQEGESAWVLAADLPFEWSGMNAATLADMLYLVGGRNKNDESISGYLYLPQTDTWSEIIAPPQEIGSSPAVFPFETKLLIIGGESSHGISDKAYLYQAVYTILVPVVR